jgi:CRISPR-associated protein Cas2
VINADEDSLRFYFLGANWQKRVEHHGAKSTYDPGGPLIV